LRLTVLRLRILLRVLGLCVLMLRIWLRLLPGLLGGLPGRRGIALLLPEIVLRRLQSGHANSPVLMQMPDVKKRG
jgi:hypothetical protein